jgi:hypothetical protein
MGAPTRPAYSKGVEALQNLSRLIAKNTVPAMRSPFQGSDTDLCATQPFQP